MCDPRPEVLERRQLEWGVADGYTEVDELLADDDIDAVEILSPTPLHAEHAIAALEPGKHVSCQKPIANSVADGRRMIEPRRSGPGCFRVTEHCCHYPPLSKARELIRVGAIGTPTVIRIKTVVGRTESGSRRTSIPPATRGDSTPRAPADTSSTTSCTSTRWRCGSSTATSNTRASGRAPRPAVLRGADGRAVRVRAGGPARHDGSVVRARHVHPQRPLRRRRVLRDPGHARVRVGDSLVRAICTSISRRSCCTRRQVGAPRSPRSTHSYDGSFRRSAAAFVDGIVAGKAPDLDPEMAIEALQLCFAVYQASNERRPVDTGIDRRNGQPERLAAHRSEAARATSRSCSGGKAARRRTAGHGHNSTIDTPGARALVVALAANAAFLAVELVGGFAFGSLALLADAAHMVSDVVALAMAYAAVRIAARPPTERHTFGFGRTEVLVAEANGVLLFASAIVIVDRSSPPPAVAADDHRRRCGRSSASWACS